MSKASFAGIRALPRLAPRDSRPSHAERTGLSRYAFGLRGYPDLYSVSGKGVTSYLRTRIGSTRLYFSAKSAPISRHQYDVTRNQATDTLPDSLLAEFERDILRDREKAGIAQARKEGRSRGKPRTIARHAAKARPSFQPGFFIVTDHSNLFIRIDLYV